MKQFKILEKKDFPQFIKRLSKKHKVVAPVSRGNKSYAFTQVDSSDQIAMKYIPTILPPKKYFMPQRETLAQYNKSKKTFQTVLEFEELVIFGVHTCDLAGIQCLNIVFSDTPKDINYIARKNRILIIGLECNDYCDEYASCKVMDSHHPNGGYDLFFTELKESFIVHVNTLEGEGIIELTGLFKEATSNHLKEREGVIAAKKKIFKDEVDVHYKDLKPMFDKSAGSKVWEDLEKRCLSCGNCTNVCPTCYCFDIIDEINLDLDTGYRIRQWDSCQNEDFAKVAGGESFREERGQRQRHRYMRKFSYPVERYARHFCTGCGRCSRTCMAKINLKETINALAKENR
ncbi:MAG: 4Fe-4S dicluster domain-containing protein [Candidatus Omnitrophica bacterium]|nr:4Fe-4S dicluster domain-containing protein [Candidatus Omnitrophota bacterium]